jgi:tRNA A-37 threonylcarbamoyl transferase component Bud32
MNAFGDLGPGAEIGHDEVVRFLAQGGFGSIYEARDVSLRRAVVTPLCRRGRPSPGRIGRRRDGDGSVADRGWRAAMSDDALEAGQIFGRYVIQRRIGAGTYGAVYEALQQPLKKRVALKVLHASQVQIPEAVQRFVQEAEATARFEHANIVTVLDLGDVDGRPFIAMEFLEGETLSQRLRRVGRLTPSQAVDLLLPIFAAVIAVHSADIVHRDLKPSNIFLARDRAGAERVKLLDFGIAKVSDADHSMTRTGAMMGSPHYMSPEQAHESRDVDARADQWALGVILYECVAGRRPFSGVSLLDVLAGVSRDPPPPLPGDLDAPVVERVILRALEKKRADRFPTVREMGLELWSLASEAVRAQCAFDLGRAASIGATPPPDSLAPPIPAKIPAADTQGSLPLSAREITAPPPPPPGARWRIALAASAVAAVIVGAVLLPARARPHADPVPTPTATLLRAPAPTGHTATAADAQATAEAPAAPPVLAAPPPTAPALAAAPQHVESPPPTRTDARPTGAPSRRHTAPRRERIFTSTGIQIH